jgi:hypothetical protein
MFHDGSMHIHERAAASSSRKAATGALLDKSMSESSFCIHSSKVFLLCNPSSFRTTNPKGKAQKNV